MRPELANGDAEEPTPGRRVAEIGHENLGFARRRAVPALKISMAN
jgi:hypothetical protein